MSERPWNYLCEIVRPTGEFLRHHEETLSAAVKWCNENIGKRENPVFSVVRIYRELRSDDAIRGWQKSYHGEVEEIQP